MRACVLMYFVPCVPCARMGYLPGVLIRDVVDNSALGFVGSQIYDMRVYAARCAHSGAVAAPEKVSLDDDNGDDDVDDNDDDNRDNNDTSVATTTTMTTRTGSIDYTYKHDIICIWHTRTMWRHTMFGVER